MYLTSDKKIKLWFILFTLHASINVFRWDELKVYNGLNRETAPIRVLTGYELPDEPIIEASGDVEGGLFLWLETDNYGRRIGFEIEWEVQVPTTTTSGPPAPPPKG